MYDLEAHASQMRIGKKNNGRSTYKNSSIFIDRVQNRDRTSFEVDWIDLWCLPKGSDAEAHD